MPRSKLFRGWPCETEIARCDAIIFQKGRVRPPGFGRAGRPTTSEVPYLESRGPFCIALLIGAHYQYQRAAIRREPWRFPAPSIVAPCVDFPDEVPPLYLRVRVGHVIMRTPTGMHIRAGRPRLNNWVNP